MNRTNLLLDKNEFSKLDGPSEKIRFNLEDFFDSEIKDFLTVCKSLGFSEQQSSLALKTVIRDSLRQHQSLSSITPTSIPQVMGQAPRQIMTGIFSSPHSDNKLGASKNPANTVQNFIFN